MNTDWLFLIGKQHTESGRTAGEKADMDHGGLTVRIHSHTHT